ncbi:hypothetical protein [Actinoplanes teichomyceticus]|uniref:hypothetical protein n=1 Tax=Actinoplanes teichomyceticus TaxID=1867 RepID=UPI00119D270D|nr:hypothetical protein [Actinoplanes teichomyceticus]
MTYPPPSTPPSPPPSEPGTQPAADRPPVRRRASWKLIGGLAAGVLALCAGGLAAVGAVVDGPDATKPGAGATAAALPVVTGQGGTTGSAGPARTTATAAAPAAGTTTAGPTTVASATPGATVASRPGPSHSPGTHPTRTSTPARPRPTTARPTTTAPPATTTPTSEPTRQGVRAGSFCSPEGAYGVTAKGTVMRCTSRDGDQARWRKA